MSSNINWANPVFGPDAVPKTSQAYLARLQQFLDQQQGGSSSGTKDSNNNSNNKRKNPSSQSDNDTSAAVKDRRHSMNNNSDEGGNTHSHTKEGSSERESPEAEDDKSGKGGRAGKGNTSDKRKEQNRNAQRAFRERKEKVLRDLEDRVNELKEAHDTSQSENQNLKEMITRLQEENAQLRKGAAPQSDFTFSIPAGATNHAPALSGLLDQTSSASSSTTPLDKNASTSTSSNNNNNNNNNNAASSFSTNDILAYLSSAPAPQTVQQPFTMIQPSPPPAGSTSAAGSGSGPGGFDDWMLNWNSSAFGTEFPQAVPPSVTNLTEQPVDNGFASLWNSLQQQSSNFNSNSNPNVNNNSSFSNSNSPTSYTSPNNINSQSQAQQQQQLSDSVQDNSSSFFSLFQNAFTPSMNQSPSSGSSFSHAQNGSSNNGINNNVTAHNGNNNVGGGMPVQSIRSGSSDLFPFAASDSNGNSPSLNSNNGSGSGTLNLNSLQNNNLNRLSMNGNGSSNADSPETCASSTSGGSDPSDAQPGTPNNGAALFSGAPGNVNGNLKSMQGGGNLKHQQSGDSQQSLFSNMGFGSFGLGSLTQQQQQVPQQQQQPHSFTNNSGFGNMFGSAGTGFDNVTTPSGVFDMMNYRDPLFANLGSASADGGVFGNDNFNFTSFLSGNSGSGSGAASGGNAPKRSDTLDFSDFLVASPPALNSNSPSAGSSTGGNGSSNNAFRIPSQSSSGLAGGKESSSSSSLPTLSSLSNSNSPASNQPSPQTSMTYGNSASSSQTGTPNWLPYDVPYNHPLIQHVMKGTLTAEDKERPDVQAMIAKLQASTGAGNNNTNISSSSKPMGSKSSPCDIDGLCSDMTMKATCKDAAREQIAKAIHTDEMTMKLYSEYLQAYSGPPNQN